MFYSTKHRVMQGTIELDKSMQHRPGVKFVKLELSIHLYMLKVNATHAS